MAHLAKAQHDCIPLLIGIHRYLPSGQQESSLNAIMPTGSTAFRRRGPTLSISPSAFEQQTTNHSKSQALSGWRAPSLLHEPTRVYESFLCITDCKPLACGDALKYRTCGPQLGRDLHMRGQDVLRNVSVLNLTRAEQQLTQLLSNSKNPANCAATRLYRLCGGRARIALTRPRATGTPRLSHLAAEANTSKQ